MNLLESIRRYLTGGRRVAAAAPAPRLTLGTVKGARTVTTPLPCVMEVVGLEGSGRTSFLMSLASQMMKRGDTVLYLTGCGGKEWADFFHAAHEAGRATECYADVPYGATTVVDVPRLVDSGALLYFGEEYQNQTSLRASRIVSDVLAAAVRHEASRSKRHLVVIFDSFAPWLDLRVLQPLGDMTNVSLVSSSFDFWPEGVDMPRSTCQVVFQHSKDWDLCDPQGQWLPPPMALRLGEAIAMLRQAPPNPPHAFRISVPALARQPAANDVPYRPANWVVPVEQTR